MLKQIIVIVCCILFFTVLVLSQDEQKVKIPDSKAWNKVCPVEGNLIKTEIKTINHNDKQYGFCSAACATVFNEDPVFHGANLNEDGTKYTGKRKKVQKIE